MSHLSRWDFVIYLIVLDPAVVRTNAKQISSFFGFFFQRRRSWRRSCGINLEECFLCCDSVDFRLLAASAVHARPSEEHSAVEQRYSLVTMKRQSILTLSLRPTQKIRLCAVTDLLTKGGHVTRSSPHGL